VNQVIFKATPLPLGQLEDFLLKQIVQLLGKLEISHRFSDQLDVRAMLSHVAPEVFSQYRLMRRPAENNIDPSARLNRPILANRYPLLPEQGKYRAEGSRQRAGVSVAPL
jgi:hypothetical protein